MEIKRWNYKETPHRNQRLVARAPTWLGMDMQSVKLRALVGS